MGNSKPSADLQTLESYEKSADQFTVVHKSPERNRAIARITELFPAGSRLLELGCGLGIDAQAMFESGYDIIASDASETMLKLAADQHPQIKDRLLKIVLPDELPFQEESFDGVVAITVLQHLTQQAILSALKEIYKVLKPGAILMVRAFEDRADIDSSNRDANGRLMTRLPVEIFTPLVHAAGFKIISTESYKSKREFVMPREYILQRPVEFSNHDDKL